MSQRLGALDSVFLNLEDACHPMHIGCLLTFKTAPESPGRPGVARIFDTVAARLPLLPGCRRRLVDVPLGLGRPVWVEDPDFDIRNHLHHVVLPPPGSREQLMDTVSTLHARRLDRGRPLWEMYLVHGLADGRTALYSKLHHAMVDGVSALELGLVLLDLDPDGALAPRVSPLEAGQPVPDTSELVAAATREAVGAIARAGVQGLRAAPGLLRGALDGAASLDSIGSMLKMLRLAPAGPLNGSVGTARRVGCVRLPLGEIKDVKNRHGASVNDVVLATIGEALSEYLAHVGVSADGLRYRVMVPVSMRSEDDRTPGNQVSAVMVELPVGPMHPERRLWAVMQEMSANKQRGRAGAADGVLAMSAAAPAPLYAVASRLGMANQRMVNVVVSNVPGVQMPVYAAGSRTLEMYPLLPLAPNNRVVVCALSYNNQMNIGLVADRTSVPDLEVLERGITNGFRRLQGMPPGVPRVAARKRVVTRI